MLAACEPVARPQPVDLSSAHSAAMAYLKALQRGDAATARAACVGSADEMRWVDAFAAMIDGMRKLNAALDARFSNIMFQLHSDIAQAVRETADDPIDLYENGNVQSSETTAMIKPQHKGFTAQYQLPLMLKKVNGVWKVDVDETYVPQPSHDQLLVMNPEQRQQYRTAALQGMNEAFRKYHRMADVFHHVADQVRSGRLKTPREVEDALAGAGR